MPSGVDGATGRARGAAVEASASVTFFRLKPGHLLLPGRALCGRLVLADIGLSERALAAIAPKAFVNAPAIWRDASPRLDAFAHKYTRGAALVVSGPAHRTGAARLAARAALRVGAGLATIASPPDAVAANAAQSTAVMVAPFADLAGFARLLADPRRNAALIGPGAGVGEATRGLVAAALTEPSAEPRAIVLDADALTSFAGDAGGLAALIAREGRATIVTPHEGEFARLFRGRSEVLDQPSKLARARAAAATLGAVVVLKGADTVVAAPDGRAAIGFDLPPTLATAGSGDVLAGLVCGLLAQRMPVFEAAAAAVWLHGAAARALGPGLIAEDLTEALPGVLRALAAIEGDAQIRWYAAPERGGCRARRRLSKVASDRRSDRPGRHRTAQARARGPGSPGRSAGRFGQPGRHEGAPPRRARSRRVEGARLGRGGNRSSRSARRPRVQAGRRGVLRRRRSPAPAPTPSSISSTSASSAEAGLARLGRRRRRCR